MDLFRNPPDNRDSPGLAANDSAMLFPIAGAALTAFFYVNQQDTLLDEYLGENRKKIDNRPVAQIPLRYPGPGGEPTKFRSVPEEEKVARENAIVEMIRKIHENQATFQGTFTEITSGNAEAAAKARQARLDGKPVPRNNDQFWVKKYEIRNLFAQEKPSTRYLPISFLANTVKSDGTTELFHGAVESLTVEVNKDILRVANTENIAIRIYGTGVDTNWRNLGKDKIRKKLHFIYTQDENRVADMRVLTKAYQSGGTNDTSLLLTSFGLNRYPDPVSFETDVFKRFRKEGLHLAVNGLFPNSVRLINDKGAILLHMARALHRIFQSNYQRCDNWVEVDDKAPLVLRFNNQLLRINRLLLSSDQKRFPDPDLDWTSVKVKGICFETDKGIVYQNTSGDEWLVKESTDLVVDQGTRIDLIAYSSQADIENLPQDLDQSKYDFKDFDSVRYVVKSSLDLNRYNFIRSELPSLRYDTPEISQQDIKFDRNTSGFGYAILASSLLAVFTFFSWISARQSIPFRLGQMTALFGGAFFLLSVLSFVSVRFKVIDWLQVNHDEVLFYSTIVLLVLSSLTIMASLRFNHSVPAGVYVMSILLLVCIGFLRATPITNKDQLTESMTAWRSAIIIVIFKAGLLLTWESFKLGLKSRVTPVSEISSGFQFTEPATGALLVGIVLLYPLFKMLLSVERPGCEAKKQKKLWLEEQIKNSQGKLREVYQQELQDLKLCDSSFKSTFDEVSGKVIGGILVFLVALSYIGAPIIAMVTRKLVPEKNVLYKATYKENSNIKLVYSVGKTLVSLVLLFISISILVPLMDFFPGEDSICSVANDNLNSFNETFDTDIDRQFFGYEEKKQQITKEFNSLRCTGTRANAIVSVIAFLVGIWMISIITPPRFSNTPAQSSAVEGFFFLAFVVFATFAVVFINDKDALRKSLEVDASRVINEVIQVFIPPG